MKQLIDEFIDYLTTVKKTSKGTISSYAGDIEKMAADMKKRGIEDVALIDEDKLLSYISSLSDANYSTASIIRHITSIKAFFRFLIDNGNINDNPAEKLRSPKMPKTDPRILNSYEVDFLLGQEFDTAPIGKRDKAILELMYATGLRVSEITALKLSNIDMSIGCLRMEDKRLIPYGQKAKEALSSYLLDARQNLIKEDTDILFVNYNGREMSRQGLWKLIKKYVKRAGIDPDITPNCLRHSFGVHLIESGANANAVQEMMGYAGSNSLTRYIKKTRKSKDPYEWARIRN